MVSLNLGNGYLYGNQSGTARATELSRITVVRSRLILLLVVTLMTPRTVQGYSVLAHEAAIDAGWDGAIAPLLKKRFPRADAEALLRARSFAYGGSGIQELGGYPFRRRFFRNLPAYLRFGAFIEGL